MVRLQHHDVTLGAVELGGRAVTQLLGIRIVVGVLIVERIVCHLTVGLVHHGVYASHLDVDLRGLPGDLGEDTMTLGEICLDVTRWLVCVAILVSGLVVEVADVCVVRHGVIKLYHGVWWLHDVELRVVRLVSGELLVIDVGRELVGTHEAAGVHVAAALIDTAHLHVLSEQRAIALLLDASDTEVLDVGAACHQLCPVDARAAVHHEACDVVRALQGETTHLQSWQVFQVERLQRGRQHRLGEQRPLGEGDSRQCGVGGKERLQFGVLGEVHARELRTLETAHVDGAEVLAPIDDDIVERGLCAGAADVERAESREVAEVERLQDGVADIGEVKPHDA